MPDRFALLFVLKVNLMPTNAYQLSYNYNLCRRSQEEMVACEQAVFISEGGSEFIFVE
jgi:hypothetical protein